MTSIFIIDRVMSPRTVADSGNLSLYCPHEDADSKKAKLAPECLITKEEKNEDFFKIWVTSQQLPFLIWAARKIELIQNTC